MFVRIRGRSRGVANIRNMFLKFARKAYYVVFVTFSQASQDILIDGKAFVVTVRHSQVFLTFAKDSQEIRQTDC